MAEPSDHEELLERVNQDPQAARLRALDLLEGAERDGDASTASFARRILGLAARELNDLPEALQQVERPQARRLRVLVHPLEQLLVIRRLGHETSAGRGAGPK